MTDSRRVVRVERGMLEGRRPRNAGCNARLGEHGILVRVPIVRVTTDDGASGFGLSRATQEQARVLLTARLDDVFSAWRGTAEAWQPFDYPLWDLACKRAGLPAYAAAAQANGFVAPDAPFQVPCYDTSLYIDDLHLAGQDEAAELIAAEARAGFERGHRAFKVKIGRGALHMALEEGMQRDVAVVRAVRAAVGPRHPIMVDANNGYNLNLTKRFLSETADCDLFWLEEPSHEDAVLYRDLREWMDKDRPRCLITDGEGDASPRLLEWAQEGVIDAVQRDIISWGFSGWLPLARQLDTWGRFSAPHHYGTFYGNYASCHLAAAARRFAFAEWDEASVPGLSAPGYAIHDGKVTVPDATGFGLALDDAAFAEAIERNGFSLEVQ